MSSEIAWGKLIEFFTCADPLKCEMSSDEYSLKHALMETSTLPRSPPQV